MLRRTMGERIVINVDLRADPAWVKCDENQLENALLNLAINARDAMPEGGTFKIESRRENPAELQNLAPGDYVMLTVSDTGIGMPKSVLERAMEPFFTTKPMGQGTGLGLSMIYGLMAQCGGGVVLESEEGKGTAVKLFLASAEEKKKNSDRKEMVEEQNDGKTPATILIAEDEDLIRMTMVDVLQEEEFHVLEAHDGESALQCLATTPNISLLITDVGLPGLNGRQLVERARANHPDLKVIFVTGYSREILQQSADGGPQDNWIKSIPVLRKPFDLTDLINKVRSLLEND
jgi:CheY-like chemotaxis protein